MRVILVFMLLCGLLLSGCGSGDGDSIDKPGAKVRYAPLRAKVRGLDPGDIGDTTSNAVAAQSYECLFQYHHLKRPYTLIPCLAEAMPEVSADGLAYTIRIRKDVYFTDDPCFPGGQGRPLTAQDFIYAWKRIANVKYRSKNWWIFDGKVAGLDEFRQYTAGVKTAKDVDYDRPVKGLKALDDHTLQIKLTKPWAQTLFLLAHLPTAPMAREAVDYYGDRLNSVTVGTGPFKLKSWKSGNTLTLVRNPKFRKETYPTESDPGDREKGYLDDAGKVMPFFDGVVYYVIEEDRPYWLTLMEGKTDSLGDRIPNDFYSQAVTAQQTLTPEMKSRGLELLVEKDPSVYWFGFNMDDPVVGKNRPLRRAMSCGLDRVEFNRVANLGRALIAKGIFPPPIKEYDPAFKNPWTEFNLEKARELMKEAEKIHGGKITVTVSIQGTDTLFRQMGECFKRNMSRIGVNIKLDYNDWPAHQEKVKTKSAQIFSMGWVGDYPDASTFMEIFYGPNGAPGPNDFNYKNPAFDDLYRQTVDLADTPRRLAQYRRLERIVCDDCPAVFTYHRVMYVPYYRYLKNYKYNVFTPEIMKYQNIDLDLRKKLIGR